VHVANGLPVSDVATPALRVPCFCIAVNLLTTCQDVRVEAGVTVRWGDELYRAVQVRIQAAILYVVGLRPALQCLRADTDDIASGDRTQPFCSISAWAFLRGRNAAFAQRTSQK
jgi:hypothetical protein